MLRGRGGVVFGLLDPVGHRAQGFLHGPGGFLAIGAFEADGVDGNVSRERYNDVDGSVHGLFSFLLLVHNHTPISTSLMEPFCWCRRRTDNPFFLASSVAL